MTDQNGVGTPEGMQIEFPSPSRSDLATPMWSPPSSPWLDSFCYSHSQSQTDAPNYSSAHEFPSSPPWGFSAEPTLWDEPTCFGNLSQLELLSEFHDPRRFIKLTRLALLIPLRGVLLRTRVIICFLHLTRLHIHRHGGGKYRLVLQDQDFPCFRVLRIGAMAYSHVKFLIHPTTERRYVILQSKQTSKAVRYGTDCLYFANGVEIIIRLQYNVKVMGGAVGTPEQSRATTSAITVVEKHSRRRKRKAATRIPSVGCDPALKRTCRHHGKMHWPITEKNKGNKSKSELKGRHLSEKIVEAEAEAFSQSSVTTSPLSGAIGSVSGPASFSWLVPEPENVNEYYGFRSEPCPSFESPLALNTFTRRLFNDLLVRLRRKSWSTGDDARGLLSELQLLFDLGLMRLYPPRSLHYCNMASMPGACYPQTTTNHLLEFTFILYSQIDFLLFQASIMQQNMPPEMAEKMIVGVKELEILDNMLEAILAVQPMFEDAHKRQINDQAVKVWLNKVMHIFHRALGLLTDCRTEIKELHIERIHNCSSFHVKGLPCWLVNLTSVSIPRKFHELLMLSKSLTEVNQLFLKFSNGNLVEPCDLIIDSIQTLGVSREVMMIPNSLEQSSMEEDDDLSSREVCSSDENLGPVVNLHDDLAIHSIHTPDMVTETGVPDLLEQPTVEAITEVGDVASSSQSLAASNAEAITEVGDVASSCQSLAASNAEAITEVGDVASSSQSLAASNAVDKQSRRKRSSKKGGRAKKTFSLEVLQQHSGKTLEEAASSLHVGKSTLKRRCRDLGINNWSELKDKNVTAEAGTCIQSSLNTSPPKTTKLQDVRPVIVKATYKVDTTKFKLFSSFKKVDLEKKLAHKFKLEVGNFKIKYEDEEKEKILVSTDSDLEECIITSESQDNSTIRLLVESSTA